MAEKNSAGGRGQFNIKAAIQIYRSRVEISSTEIASIFGCAERGTKVNRLKKDALNQMRTEGRSPYGYGLINTKCAFRAWGLNIEELEKDYLRYKKLGFGDLPDAPMPTFRTHTKGIWSPDGKLRPEDIAEANRPFDVDSYLGVEEVNV